MYVFPEYMHLEGDMNKESKLEDNNAFALGLLCLFKSKNESNKTYKNESNKTYNVTLSRFRLTIVAMEKQCVIYWSVCACVHVGTRARGHVHV